jgi:hypothetical protein
MNSLRSTLALRTNWRASESLVPNKCAPTADVPLDFLPRRQVVLRSRTERVPNSDQRGLTLWAYRSVIQLLVTVANSPKRRSLEDFPAGGTNECRCQLLFHARSGAERPWSGAAGRTRPTWDRDAIPPSPGPRLFGDLISPFLQTPIARCPPSTPNASASGVTRRGQ